MVIGSAQVVFMAEQRGLTGVLGFTPNAPCAGRSTRHGVGAGGADRRGQTRAHRQYPAQPRPEGVVAVDIAGQVQTLNPAMGNCWTSRPTGRSTSR